MDSSASFHTMSMEAGNALVFEHLPRFFLQSTGGSKKTNASKLVKIRKLWSQRFQQRLLACKLDRPVLDGMRPTRHDMLNLLRCVFACSLHRK